MNGMAVEVAIVWQGQRVSSFFGIKKNGAAC